MVNLSWQLLNAIELNSVQKEVYLKIFVCSRGIIHLGGYFSGLPYIACTCPVQCTAFVTWLKVGPGLNLI